MEDTQFRRIIDRFGYSWAGYRRVRKGVKKRLSRRMQEIRCRNIDAYIDLIEQNREEWLHFERLMTVSISRFFRDRELWKIMHGQILPHLIHKKSRIIKVWFAGCASGEEVYTFKILWEDLRNADAHIPDIFILATDMNPDYLLRAKEAVYTHSSMKNVTETIRSAYFKKYSRGRFVLKPDIKDGIVWEVNQLLSEHPGITFDLIFLRNNLLTYYLDEIKIPAVKRVVENLSTGGFFIIGKHERLPNEVVKLKSYENSKQWLNSGTDNEVFYHP
jgi:chemotaxis methyl-accepting protein methylase